MKQQILSVAVLDILRDFDSNHRNFSAYDVTVELRKRVNNGEVELTDKVPTDINGMMTFPVNHEEVKEVVSSLWHNDFLKNRQREVLTGTNYWTYSCQVAQASSTPNMPVAAPTMPVKSTYITGTCPPNHPALTSSCSLTPPTLPVVTAAEIKEYVRKRRLDGKETTLKQIASRFKTSKLTIRDVADIVSACPHIFQFDVRTPFYKSVVRL